METKQTENCHGALDKPRLQDYHGFSDSAKVSLSHYELPLWGNSNKY